MAAFILFDFSRVLSCASENSRKVEKGCKIYLMVRSQKIGGFLSTEICSDMALGGWLADFPQKKQLGKLVYWEQYDYHINLLGKIWKISSYFLILTRVFLSKFVASFCITQARLRLVFLGCNPPTIYCLKSRGDSYQFTSGSIVSFVSLQNVYFGKAIQNVRQSDSPCDDKNTDPKLAILVVLLPSLNKLMLAKCKFGDLNFLGVSEVFWGSLDLINACGSKNRENERLARKQLR